MYELIVLAHLMRRPAHGYLIAKIINDIIGPYARISNGRLYPLLAKLKEAGLIRVYANSTPGEHTDRQLCKYQYQITEAGKKRFHELMMDTTSNPGEYQKVFLQKVCFLDLLQSAERLRVLDHYLNYCHTHIIHLTTEKGEVIGQSPPWGEEWDAQHIQTIADVLQHSIDQWQVELSWAKKLYRKEIEPGQEEVLERLV